MSLAAAAEGAGTQVLVRFVTRLPAELRVPESQVAVPAGLRRYGLSQIINHLLALSPARPFDFLVAGELLRKSLAAHLTERGLSAETALEIEYVPAVVPPEPKAAVPHDDWVSSLAALPGGAALTGGYDGALRLVAADGAATVATFAAHAGPVTALAALPARRGAPPLVVSAGKDGAVRLWRLDAAASASADAPARLIASFSGHTDAVEAVAVSPGGARLATAGWDGSLRLWRCGGDVLAAYDDAGGDAAPRAPPRKKKKKDGGADGGAAAAADGSSGFAGGVAEEAVGALAGHLHCVSSLAWPAEDTLFSGGWDHSVRRWDAVTGDAAEVYNGSKAVLCVASSSETPDVVAFGGADRCVRVWDTRAAPRAGDALALRALAAHGNWVTALAWCPRSAHHLVSASTDHTLRLWDVRCAVPLATLTAHSAQVLCAGWLGPGVIASGGADCALRTFELEAPLLRG
jgi:ribosome biogenesis protein YTM1